MHVVIGLADGRIALVTKMHHALADGLASANLLAKAVVHYPNEALAEYTPTTPDPVPSRGEVLRWAAVDHARNLRATPGGAQCRGPSAAVRGTDPATDSAKVMSPIKRLV
jgi:diacylglycerol O-acyltransferase / wax synthase